jgi:hypothetical protein
MRLVAARGGYGKAQGRGAVLRQHRVWSRCMPALHFLPPLGPHFLHACRYLVTDDVSRDAARSPLVRLASAPPTFDWQALGWGWNLISPPGSMMDWRRGSATLHVYAPLPRLFIRMRYCARARVHVRT